MWQVLESLEKRGSTSHRLLGPQSQRKDKKHGVLRLARTQRLSHVD